MTRLLVLALGVMLGGCANHIQLNTCAHPIYDPQYTGPLYNFQVSREEVPCLQRMTYGQGWLNPPLTARVIIYQELGGGLSYFIIDKEWEKP